MDNNYLQMFFDESSEYLRILNENVLALEQDPENIELINEVFRAAHSLKGMAATMGFQYLTDLTHKIENILDKVRNGQLNINEDIIDLLFDGLDYIKQLVEDIKNEGEEATDVSAYIKDLENYVDIEGVSLDEDSSPGDISFSDEEKKEIFAKMHESDNIYKVNVKLVKDCLLKNVRGFMILKNAEELGYLVKSKPTKDNIEDEDFGDSISLILVSKLNSSEIKKELGNIVDVDKVEIEVINNEFNESSEQQNTIKKVKPTSKKTSKKRLTSMEVSPTVRVDINKLDNLMNMVGELLINKTRLEDLNIESEVYQDIIQQLDRVTMELHHIVMQIRMVPIGGIFNRFPRMVRDLSKELNKEIDLIIEGAETELDRSIIDELVDPLIHILRNAVDHGIESPEERVKKGKDRRGTILLQAYQKGSEIIIEVEDDGRGIEPEVLAEKAIEKGLVTLEEVEAMDDRDKLNLIFRPGFSTSKTITDVSGRGVGMDVVKRVVESLDGQIFIESDVDVGTRFTISLPLTLAITQALMVKVNEEIFAIPLNAISETLTVTPDDIRQVRGQDVIVLRDRTIPIVECSKQLNMDVEYGLYLKREEIPVVIINQGDRQVGLIVDELLNQQEIVIKSLGSYLVDTKNISGATIVGDGDVALILDVRNIA
ncbi:chemotaxis protein CheA [Halothermothrix orenii]|uniref:Chemotaxis protein CheA n=1 Tax=Halothermothrix orenii (strain H 168 / OCM 544 / DSM 9562) TaxID=373903 RepID=B8CW48_HALOH|nr:chemotaxis protein CheA [Halothermothrix orenii]ACL69517.1 CheA signal transduction histidine kinase [Halothermothrix orenii H 168]